MGTPVLHVLAGSNGAGKSTLADLILVPRTHMPFVNADRIAERLWPGDRARQSEGAVEVSRLAASERQRLLERRISLITETVFSHANKIDLIEDAQHRGYTVSLHVVLVPEELAVARVVDRTVAGGHAVPEDRIRAGYARLWPLVARALSLADRADVYDNSLRDTPFRRIAVYEYGQAVGRPQWPAWAPMALRDGA